MYLRVYVMTHSTEKQDNSTRLKGPTTRYKNEKRITMKNYSHYSMILVP
jgi:hypothetical protein